MKKVIKENRETVELSNVNDSRIYIFVLDGKHYKVAKTHEGYIGICLYRDDYVFLGELTLRAFINELIQDDRVEVFEFENFSDVILFLNDELGRNKNEGKSKSKK